MSISVVCPECEHAFSVRDEYAGKRGKCPKCGGIFRAEPAEPSVSVGIPAALAARSGVSLGGKSSANGGFALDTAAPSHAPAPAGKKAGGGSGKKKKSGRSHAGGPAMPVWGWISLAILGLAAFTGAGFIYYSRGNEAVKIAESVDDGSEAAQTKQKLLDQIKELEDEIAALKTSLASAEKAIGTKPKEKTPLGKIEETILPGVVKVIPYINDQPQQSTATGFFVNDKFLVATTYRVCEGANKIMIKLATGTEYEVEGIVAADQKQDVAILKPKSEMPGVKVLKFADNPTLARGDTVYAIGNPGKQEFTTSRGTITRVITQDKYVSEKPMFDLEFTRGSSVSTSFIEHDARIFPGDYGGPLLNENLDVIGMNQLLVTMVMNDGRTIVQTFGAAEEIKHIKTLADKATDAIIPYPPASKKPPKQPPTPQDDGDDKDDEPKDDGEAKPDDEPADPGDEGEKEGDDKDAMADLAGKIDGLYTECEGFEWAPKNEADYGKLANIARYVTEAKNLAPGDAQHDAANASADKVFARLAEIDLKDSAEATNKLAGAVKPKKDAGIFAICTVKGTAPIQDKPALMVQLEGSDKFALVMTEKVSEASVGSKWLLLGQFESEQVLSFKSGDGTAGSAFLVRAKVLVDME